MEGIFIDTHLYFSLEMSYTSSKNNLFSEADNALSDSKDKLEISIPCFISYSVMSIIPLLSVIFACSCIH